MTYQSFDGHRGKLGDLTLLFSCEAVCIQAGSHPAEDVDQVPMTPLQVRNTLAAHETGMIVLTPDDIRVLNDGLNAVRGIDLTP